ncbi:neutral zinc metallopeptidase [Cellulomonas sp. WB94]|uniref:KPN_02809 family neutral zinc metallopeptidase n=1 Tax=Cellulomonas sp. WB94 TaxID=2173174 RepID=UPI001F5BC14B|nr:neutral zinc metallopeptidase [Cellulomonas sp. WB94]
MTFTEGGSFEGGRVKTSRGRRGAAAGGGVGLLAIAVYVISQLTGVNLTPVVDAVQGGAPGAVQATESTLGTCSAAEANSQRDCRLSATVYALDTYWAETLPANNLTFSQPDVWSFESAMETGCGTASASTGPFYCPPDKAIYIDLGFYDLLQSQYGASGGALAEMYVVAHEYGHHIQQITGVMDQANRQGTGADSDSVKTELQADCYAGLWTGHAATVVDPKTGVTFLNPITQTELSDALSAAQAVGDDHIQQQSSGGVNPDTWTHGSSEERQRWFMTGYTEGTITACDTFSAASL